MISISTQSLVGRRLPPSVDRAAFRIIQEALTNTLKHGGPDVSAQVHLEFADHELPELRRHLLRIWLSVPNSRPLDPRFQDNYGATAAGAFAWSFGS